MTHRLALVVAALLLAAPALAREVVPAAEMPQHPPSPAEISPEAVDRALYATGLSIAKNLEPYALTPKELDRLVKGIRDGVNGKPEFAFDEVAQKALTQLATARLAVASEKEKVRGEAYLKKAAAEKGAVKRESGLVMIPLVEGKGASPKATDRVKLNYVGTLVDGKEFGSNAKRGAPFETQVDQVMPCWTEALQVLKVGGKAKVVCPPAMAYGAGGRPPQIAGNAVLVFALELVEIVGPGTPGPVPAPGPSPVK